MNAMRSLLATGVILIVGCASKAGWLAEDGQVVSLTAAQPLQLGRHDIMLCKGDKSIGSFRFARRFGATRLHHFCSYSPGNDPLGFVEQSVDSLQICFWRETGHCANGLCHSYASAENCGQFPQGTAVYESR
nr:unknown Function [uncultured bacterium]